MANMLLLLSLVLVATTVLFMPLIRYVWIGWRAKRADILDGLNAESREKYFAMFCRDESLKDSCACAMRLDDMYVHWYGRRLFVGPSILLLLVAGACLYFAFGALFLEKALVVADAVPLDMKLTGISAIAGAYLWVVDDFISRARRLDFSPADVHWAVLRFVIAVPMGYSFASIASESAGPFVAFALGAFPLTTLKKMLRRFAESRLGYDDIGVAGSDGLVRLQGVNSEIADRLANEDITTITQMAYCDPIRVTMRSNLTFNVVTDLMNQALAWEYLDGGMDKIRRFGLRGAVEIKHVYDALENNAPDTAEYKRVSSLLPVIATSLDQTEGTLRNVLAEIAEDPFTDYLDSIWV